MKCDHGSTVPEWLKFVVNLTDIHENVVAMLQTSQAKLSHHGSES